ncbi:uncharacterized protein LOC135463305 [Liolophura sinensis]|uniref:uncharacterized protein LOC135463305 n=1 Tax=Liolophura sinensis TaxID=3198878 RepID=UPI003158792A
MVRVSTSKSGDLGSNPGLLKFCMTQCQEGLKSETKTTMSRSSKKNGYKSPAKSPTSLTESQMEEQIKEAKLQCKNLIKNYSPKTHRHNDEVKTSITRLNKIYNVFKPLPPETATKCRRAIGLFFVDNDLVPILCEIVIDYLKTGWLDAEGKQDVSLFSTMHEAVLILVNYSDSSVEISDCEADVPGFFECVGEQLKNLHVKLSTGKPATLLDQRMTGTLLDISNNTSNADKGRKKLRELGFMQILKPFLQLKDEGLKLTAFVCLATLVDEKESGMLHGSVSLVSFLLNVLSKALKHPTRRNHGWSARELTQAVTKLARSDVNKKLLVKEGALPLLLELCNAQNKEEQREAVNALWALSFDDENKELIIQEPGMMKRLMELGKSSDADVKKSALGIMWILRYNLRDKKDYHELGKNLIGKRLKTSKSPSKEPDSGDFQHVMISYQWDSQDVLLKVRDQLRTQGYNIWMDVDCMEGSTLQAMADAVENSAAVLMCMSRKYKDSPNCRAEAEYAFQRRVPIIPLLMEDGYKADGWLGILLGSKLFFDFSGRYSFESRFDSLIKALGVKGQTGEQGVKVTSQSDTSKGQDTADSAAGKIIPVVKSKILSVAPPVSEEKAKVVKLWGNKEITSWLKSNKLDRSSMSTLSGKQLVFLRNLKGESPETFYGLLQKNLALTSIEDLMNFVDALTELL